jgi:hypothetical protein
MSSEEEGDFSTKRLQDLLETMYDDLTDAAILAKKIYYASKVPRDFFTHPFRLHESARRLLGVKRISLEELLKLWIPRWKREGRLNANGSRVRLGKEEAQLVGYEPEEEVSVYDLCSRISDIFVETPPTQKVDSL